MQSTGNLVRRRVLLVGSVLVLLVGGWLARDAIWQVAQAASAEASRLAAECSDR
ncbi:hypothetical protein [Arenimonas alkanexedens]